MPQPPPQSYLLRLWREYAGAPLRATLIPVGQPEIPRHFATLDALCAFLHDQAIAAPGDHDERDGIYCTRSEIS
jgi:hypothetical protein